MPVYRLNILKMSSLASHYDNNENEKYIYTYWDATKINIAEKYAVC